MMLYGHEMNGIVAGRIGRALGHTGSAVIPLSGENQCIFYTSHLSPMLHVPL